MSIYSRSVRLHVVRYYQKRPGATKLKQSRLRKGIRYNNAVIERFFVAEDIEAYNHERIKQKLKGLSPVAYRTQAQLTA